jgi:hypothetical protein
MAINTSASRSQILAQLRTLRGSLADAREALMHFKADRVDRDKLEPAARRVDDLMNLFAAASGDRTRSALWVAEIQSGVEQVTNPKATVALRRAQVDLASLRESMAALEAAAT